MSESLRNWWGFRLRVPVEYEPASVTRVESTSLFLVVACVMELGWLTALVLGVVGNPESPRFFLLYEVLVPVGITVTLVVIGYLIPRSVLDVLRLSPGVVLGRERGDLARWDRLVLVLALMVSALMLLRLKESHWPTALVMLLDVVLVSVGLLLQQRVDFTTRRWKVEIPAWLLMGQGKDGAEDGDEIPEPEPGAKVYTFKADDATSYRVGVLPPADELGKLRQLNADHGGRLYRTSLPGVVLVDRAPVDGIGREALLRLVRQVLTIARKHNLTRLQLANTVLAFVQEAIQYRYDRDSTSHVPGGPYEEYGRFALETVADGCGDCECTAIMALSLLRYLGFEVAMLHVSIRDPDSGEVTQHAAVGLDSEALMATDASLGGFDLVRATDGSSRLYLYGETAIEGDTRAFGSVPPDWKDVLTVDRTELVPAPVVSLGAS